MFSASDKSVVGLKGLGRPTIVRDSRVGEGNTLVGFIPSSTELVKFCVNLAGPPVKPKYSLMTDSGQVP